MEIQLSALQDQVATLNAALAPFIYGQPIMALQTANDIALFDALGYGSGFYAGWGLCNGNTYTYNGRTTISPLTTDRCLIMAGGTYAVNDTPGSATVSLTAAQNGLHTHVLTQTPHTHNLTDNGHNHGVTDPQHTHAFTGTPHNHTGTTASDGDHNHTYASNNDAVNDGGAGASAWDGVTLTNTGVNGAHTHTFTTDNSTQGGNNAVASTGVSVDNAYIGITETDEETVTITAENSGTGAAHENMQPSYAVYYAIKL